MIGYLRSMTSEFFFEVQKIPETLVLGGSSEPLSVIALVISFPSEVLIQNISETMSFALHESPSCCWSARSAHLNYRDANGAETASYQAKKIPRISGQENLEKLIIGCFFYPAGVCLCGLPAPEAVAITVLILETPRNKQASK